MNRQHGHKALRRIPFAILTAMGWAGCMDVDTEIHVKGDGSATVSQTVLVTSEALGSLMTLDGDGLMNERHLKARAAGLGRGVEYLGANEVVQEDGSRGYVARYEVSDIRDLKLTGNFFFGHLLGQDAPEAWADDGVVWDFQFAPGKEPVLSIVQGRQEEVADSPGANIV